MTRSLLGLTLVIATAANGCAHPGVRRGGYVAGSLAFVAGIAMIAASETGGSPCGDRGECAPRDTMMTTGAISAAVGAIALIALVATQTDDPPDDPAAVALPPTRELDLSRPTR